MVKSCYIHIPFCESICSYCDFCKMYYYKKFVDQYLTELEQEIKDSYNGEELDTIYIGGGTPSCLNIDQLKKLFKIIDNLNKSKNIEYTIECNFENTDKEKLDLFQKKGINRISFGLESIHPKKLQVLERNTSKEKVKETIKYCKEIGIHNINIDLMYALQQESKEILKKDLDFVKSLDIEHISTYSLIIEPHTKLYLKGIDYIEEEQDREFYDLICKELRDWDHYEISNFSKEQKYRSKHNMTYWKNEEYYGFGLGSSGYEGNIRYTKTRSITKYLSHDYIREDGLEFLSTKDKVKYEIILNLRTIEGIDLDSFQKKYSHSLEEYYSYQTLIEKGHLVKKENKLFIPKDLWYISNRILVELLEGEVHV